MDPCGGGGVGNQNQGSQTNSTPGGGRDDTCCTSNCYCTTYFYHLMTVVICPDSVYLFLYFCIHLIHTLISQDHTQPTNNPPNDEQTTGTTSNRKLLMMGFLWTFFPNSIHENNPARCLGSNNLTWMEWHLSWKDHISSYLPLPLSSPYLSLIK